MSICVLFGMTDKSKKPPRSVHQRPPPVARVRDRLAQTVAVEDHADSRELFQDFVHVNHTH